MSPDLQYPGETAKEARYRLKLEQQAANFHTSTPSVDEVRKWEGADAARQAASVRPQDRYTRIAHNVSTSQRPVYQRGDVPHTNTMAILAIVFGLGGGLLGIVFGHIALSQIERTGEAGRGLAITGLVFGYLGAAVVVIMLISFGSAVSRY